ncbi:MAG: nucleotidyltransferase domain-containing protein [Acidobacteria bacterium]|nr:nucleotidyltransferase domain-containing protein [Acidobacteriota bacterium]
MNRIENMQSRRFRDILADVKMEVLKLFGNRLKQLILYGSYARNEQERDSDIDIMVLVDETDNGLRKYTYLIADIMTNLSIKHNIFISITEETFKRYYEYVDVLPFYRNIYDEGIEIYGKEAA